MSGHVSWAAEESSGAPPAVGAALSGAGDVGLVGNIVGVDDYVSSRWYEARADREERHAARSRATALVEGARMLFGMPVDRALLWVGEVVLISLAGALDGVCVLSWCEIAHAIFT